MLQETKQQVNQLQLLIKECKESAKLKQEAIDKL